MVTICPFAEWRPLPEATSQPAIVPRVFIFHTMVGSLLGTERFFRESTGVESHFGVGGPTDGPELDGKLFQWMDARRQADANFNANEFALSVETSDGGDPNRPWSTKQVETLVRLGDWAADTFGIPRRICPAWNASGFGWHIMFGAPGPWTPVAKTCPGPVRIAQLKTFVLPAIFDSTQDREEQMVIVSGPSDEIYNFGYYESGIIRRIGPGETGILQRIHQAASGKPVSVLELSDAEFTQFKELISRSLEG